MIGFATVCSDNYVALLDKLIRSILKYNPKFDNTFVVFHDARLSDASKEKLSSLYKFTFYRINTARYTDHNKGHIKHYSMESFNLKSFEKVIFIDCDLLCMRNIDDVIDCQATLGMAKENRRAGTFNAGLIVIGGEHLTDKTFLELLHSDYSTCARFGVDQKVYNEFFSGKIQELPNKFNVLISEVDYVKQHEVIFYHYIHKPNLAKGQKRIPPAQLKIWKDL